MVPPKRAKRVADEYYVITPAPSRGSKLGRFEDRGHAHSAGRADGDQAAAAAALAQQLRERRDEARAGRRERVADRDAAAFDVELERSIEPSGASRPSRSRQNFSDSHAFSVASVCDANASWIS